MQQRASGRSTARRGRPAKWIVWGLGVCALLAVIPASAQASPLTSFAYVANAADNSVSVVNTSTNEVVTTIPVLEGAYPAQKLAAAPDGKFVYAASTFSGIVAIDTATNTVAWQMTPPPVVEELPGGTNFTESEFLPGLASGMAVSPDSQFLYVALQGTNAVAVVNTTTHKLIATISVESCPSGIDIAPNNSRLYVVNICSHSVSVIDPSTNLVTGTVSPGNGPENVAVSPNSAFAYISGTGTTAVLDTSSNTVAGSLPPGLGGPMAFSPSGATAYLAGGPGPGPEVSALATATKTITASTPVEEYPFDLAITPDGQSLYLVNENENDLSVISTATNAVVGSVLVGEQPMSVAITPPIEGPPPAGGGEESGGSNPSPSPAPIASPSPPLAPAPIKHKKPLKCHKGFKKHQVHGKAKCVRIKKRR